MNNDDRTQDNSAGVEPERLEYLRDLAIRNRKRIGELTYELSIERAKCVELEREVYQLRQQVDLAASEREERLSMAEVREGMRLILERLNSK